MTVKPLHLSLAALALACACLLFHKDEIVFAVENSTTVHMYRDWRQKRDTAAIMDAQDSAMADQLHRKQGLGWSRCTVSEVRLDAESIGEVNKHLFGGYAEDSTGNPFLDEGGVIILGQIDLLSSNQDVLPGRYTYACGFKRSGGKFGLYAFAVSRELYRTESAMLNGTYLVKSVPPVDFYPK